MTALRTRMLEDLPIRNSAAKTQRVYIGSVAAFARHFGRSPGVLGPEEIRAYLMHLRDERKVSWSRFNQVVSALRFLYRYTLGREERVPHLLYPRGYARL